MMRVYLLRHGIAEDAGAGQPDSERKLTNEGREKLRKVLTSAAEAGVAPGLIVSSPYVRAVQTAEEAADRLSYHGEILRSAELVPHSNSRRVWNLIREFPEEPSVMFVGHEPLFSQSAAYLLNAPSMQIDFKKAGILALEFSSLAGEPRGILSWYLTPKLTAR